MQVIIYRQDSGVPAVVVPTQDALDKFGIQAIARKDVPPGKPYKIVESDDLPVSEVQENWTVDEADLTDGFGSDSNEFPEGA